MDRTEKQLLNQLDDVNEKPSKFSLSNVSRIHWIVLITWTLAIMNAAQQVVPIFLFYRTPWRCSGEFIRITQSVFHQNQAI